MEGIGFEGLDGCMEIADVWEVRRAPVFVVGFYNLKPLIPRKL